MSPRLTTFLLLLLLSPARAQLPTTQKLTSDLTGPYATTQANPPIRTRGEISHRVEKLLIQQARYLVSTLHPWNHDARAELLTDGGSAEAEIRPNAHTVYGLSVLYRTAPADAFTQDFTRDITREKSLAILRFLLPTHGAGDVKLKDGKLWHNQWQSALWAYSAGQACWLMWDDLDTQERWLAARMICDEADRFIDAKPPMQILADTKAEENIWDSQIISLAYCMFPNHPHHEKYRQAAIRWIINSFVTQADEKRNTMIDGKPLKDWLVGANLHEDFTLENHGHVHPDYMSCTTMCMFQKMLYEWAGEKPPQALDWNVQNIYAVSKLLAFPDGGWMYLNGQDWQLHRNADWFDLHCPIAIQYHDPQAATLMRIVLETAEKMAARNPDGPIVLPKGETIFASTQHFILEGYARSYLLLLANGEGPAPEPEDSLWKDLIGLHVFDSGKFAIMRTDKSVATISWGPQIMAMVMPVQKDLLISPDPQSLVGFIDNDTVLLRQFKRTDIPGTLAVCMALDRGASPHRPGTTQPVDSKLNQRIGFIALPDGRTIFVQTVTLLSDTKPHSMNLAPLPVLNDRQWVYHDGKRTLTFENGKQTFDAASADRDPSLRVRTHWLNVDDAMGIIMLASTGEQAYEPRPSRGAARLQQMLYLDSVPRQAIDAAKPGDVIAHTVAIFYPSQKSAETAAVSNRCSLEGDPSHPIVTLDDGRQIEFDLQHLTVTMRSANDEKH